MNQVLSDPHHVAEIFTAKDAAKYLKVSVPTILRLANQGLIPGSKIGHQWRFSKESILKLVKDNPILEREKINS